MIVAELRIVPVGSGSSSMEEAMERVVHALEETGIKYQIGPLGTTLETDDMGKLWDAVEAAHESLTGQVPRIVTSLTIDHRLDKEETTESLAKVQR